MGLGLLFEIIQCVSVLIAAIVAIVGIKSWQREVRWKRKYKLAEETLSIFYEISDKFDMIRSPAGYVGEGKTRKRSENESKDESEILDSAYVIIERYDREKDPFIKLKSLRYRFMALFGMSAIAPKLKNYIFIVTAE